MRNHQKVFDNGTQYPAPFIQTMIVIDDLYEVK